MANRKLDLIGMRFERLKVLGPAPKRGRRTMWRCLCVCGNKIVASTVALRRKVRPVRSCGCLQLERTRKANTTHGMKGTREYSAWQAMLNRCRNLRVKEYSKYGAIGIRVCDRWEKFENFFADMGPRPIGTTIDRVDNTGDYCPGNCRWADYQEQAQNRSSNVYVSVPVSILERILGMTSGNLSRYMRRGLDPIKIINRMVEK